MSRRWATFAFVFRCSRVVFIFSSLPNSIELVENMSNYSLDVNILSQIIIAGGYDEPSGAKSTIFMAK